MKLEHKILHQKFVRFGANAKVWIRKCVLLLSEIERHRIWEQKGFGSIYEYAAKLAGLNHEQVNEALRVLAKIEDKPELKKVAEEKGINALKPIVTIATVETASFWAEKVQAMSKNTLETYVREFKKANLSEHSQELRVQESNGGLPRKELPTSQTIIMDLEPEIAQQLQKLKGSGDWNTLMKVLLDMRVQKLEAEKPAAVSTTSRHIPVRIQKHVFARYNGMCAFPGCDKTYEIRHHTQRFALEKVHDPDRLYGLCKAHERLAHLGLIENEDLSPQHWRIRNQPDTSEPKYGIDTLVAKYRSAIVPNG